MHQNEVMEFVPAGTHRITTWLDREFDKQMEAMDEEKEPHSHDEFLHETQLTGVHDYESPFVEGVDLEKHPDEADFTYTDH